MSPVRLFPLQPLHTPKHHARTLDPNNRHAEIIFHDVLLGLARIPFYRFYAFDG